MEREREGKFSEKNWQIFATMITNWVSSVFCLQLHSAVAQPHDLTCQVCEKQCYSTDKFYKHMHKYHPDYWRVFAGTVKCCLHSPFCLYDLNVTFTYDLNVIDQTTKYIWSISIYFKQNYFTKGTFQNVFNVLTKQFNEVSMILFCNENCIIFLKFTFGQW